MNEEDVFQEQDDQYTFPYHHIPNFSSDGTASRVRDMDWGFDYLACMQYAKDSIQKNSPQSVLEVGCGDAAIIGSLSRKIKRLVGVDLSKRAITFARAFYSDIEFLVQDAATMTETFDAVMAVEVLEHIPDQNVSQFLRTLADRTNKGGLIFISVPSINLPLYAKHYRHYDPELLEKQIKQANIDIEIQEIRFFRSPVFGENAYKRCTSNRLFTGEIHPIRRLLWRKISNGLARANPNTAQHVVAVLKKN